MSRIDIWSDAERDLYAVGSQAILDRLERQIEDQRRAWSETYGIDSTSAAETNREFAAKMAKLEEDHKAWLASYLASLYDDGESPTQDVAQGQVVHPPPGSSPAPASPPAGPGPGQHPITDADIASMSMQEYQAFRAKIGLANGGGHRGLFG